MDRDCERWSVLWAANSVTIELHVVNHLMIGHNNIIILVARLTHQGLPAIYNGGCLIAS